MIVTVNGERHDLPAGTTVRALIERLGLAKGACAAEVNKQLVPRREHETRALGEGDVVEVVSLVEEGDARFLLGSCFIRGLFVALVFFLAPTGGLLGMPRRHEQTDASGKDPVSARPSRFWRTPKVQITLLALAAASFFVAMQSPPFGGYWERIRKWGIPTSGLRFEREDYRGLDWHGCDWAAYERLLAEWKRSSAEVQGYRSWLVVEEPVSPESLATPPHRTWLVDSECDQPVVNAVYEGTWAGIARQLEAHIELLKSRGDLDKPKWWTISMHGMHAAPGMGTRLTFRDPRVRYRSGDSSGPSYAPNIDFLADAVESYWSTLLQERESTPMPQDAPSATNPKHGQMVARAERAAMIRVLVLLRTHLKPGDHLQFFACHSADFDAITALDRDAGSRKDRASTLPPNPLLVRLAAFLEPGVRLVGYQGRVRFSDRAGLHQGVRSGSGTDQYEVDEPGRERPGWRSIYVRQAPAPGG